MTDAANLYKQLEILAQQNQTDVESLILQIQDMQFSTSVVPASDKYSRLLMSATSLVSDMRSVDKVLSNWYEYVEQVVIYDISLLLIYEENHALYDMLIIRYLTRRNISIQGRYGNYR